MQKAVVYLALFLAFACLVVGLLVAGDVPALTDAERERERIENAAREAKLALEVKQKEALTPWTQAAKVGFGVLVLVAILCVILVTTLWGARRALTIAANEQGIFPYLIGRARWRDEDGQRQSGWVMWNNNLALTAGSVVANGRVTAMVPAGFEREQAETTARAQYVQMAAAIYRHPPIVSGNKYNGAGPVQGNSVPELEPGEPVLNWPEIVPLPALFTNRQPSLESLVIGAYPTASGRLETASLSLHQLMHTLAVGASGWGKSTWLRALLWQVALAPEPIEVVAIDVMGSEFNALYNWGKLRYPVARTAQEAMAELQAVSIEIERRKHLYERYPLATKLPEYNAASGETLPPWLVVVDEGTNLLNQSGTGEYLRAVIQSARQYGVYCQVSGVSAKHNVIDTQTRDNFSSRLCFRTSPTSSRVVLDDRAASDLTKKGRFFAQLEGQMLTELQAPYVGRDAFLNALTNGGPKLDMPQVSAQSPNADDDPAAGLSEDQIEMILGLVAEGQTDSAIAQQVFGYRNARRVEQVRAVSERDT